MTPLVDITTISPTETMPLVAPTFPKTINLPIPVETAPKEWTFPVQMQVIPAAVLVPTMLLTPDKEEEMDIPEDLKDLSRDKVTTVIHVEVLNRDQMKMEDILGVDHSRVQMKTQDIPEVDPNRDQMKTQDIRGVDRSRDPQEMEDILEVDLSKDLDHLKTNCPEVITAIHEMFQALVDQDIKLIMLAIGKNPNNEDPLLIITIN